LFDNVYIIDGQEGIIYKRGQNWVREYIENGNTTIEALNIQRYELYLSFQRCFKNSFCAFSRALSPGL
jgi:hypothetical protein